MGSTVVLSATLPRGKRDKQTKYLTTTEFVRCYPFVLLMDK